MKVIRENGSVNWIEMSSRISRKFGRFYSANYLYHINRGEQTSKKVKETIDKILEKELHAHATETPHASVNP
jgi:hypothetical protein